MLKAILRRYRLKPKSSHVIKKKNAAFNQMKTMAADEDPNTIVLCMDLQKVLPCPKLCVGEAFYRRKLSIYNFCIHNLKTGISHMFLWPETTAKRGASEILSCLNKFLEANGFLDAATPKKMYIFADNCGGQNKNHTVIAANLRLIHCKYFERIEMNYLVSGHSSMACDRAFGVIENVIGNSGLFMKSISNFYKIIGTKARKITFPTIIMQREDFKDFDQMFISKKVIK